MSERMTCPGCDVTGSSVRSRFLDDQPCPHCGLSATAASELIAVRQRRADAQITARYEAAVKRVDELERENRRLQAIVDGVTAALEGDA